MIRDCFGTELKPGNIVQVMIGNPPQPFRGRITGLREGGVSLMMPAKGQPQGQTGMTPDIVVIQLDVVCIPEGPGQPHGALMRIPDPETEHIVKKGN